jgi:hypothetical protein
MNDDNHQLNELSDGLSELVAGLVAEPVPDDLKQQIRSRLDEEFKPRLVPARSKRYTAVVIAVSMVATTAAAVVFMLTSATRRSVPTVDPIGIVAVAPRPNARAMRLSSVDGPSMWAYHRAANDSLDRLDGLLAEHAAVVLTTGHPSHRQSGPSATLQILEEI